MSKYKESSIDYPTVDKPAVITAGFRRFLILLVLFGIGLVLLVGVVTDPSDVPAPPDTITATPTAVPSGVTVNVEQSAPAVNVNVQQDAPPPPPPDNAPALIAQQTALDARARADMAYNTAAALAPRVDALEAGHERLAAAPDIQPTLVAFEQNHGRLQSELNQLRWGVLGAFIGLGLLGLVMGLMLFPHGRAPHPTTLTISQNDPVQLHGADTVQSTTSGEPLVIRRGRPELATRVDDLSNDEKRYIQHTYNRLKTYSGTCRHIWGYHNSTTLACVKSVVRVGE